MRNYTKKSIELLVATAELYAITVTTPGKSKFCDMYPQFVLSFYDEDLKNWDLFLANAGIGVAFMSYKKHYDPKDVATVTNLIKEKLDDIYPQGYNMLINFLDFCAHYSEVANDKKQDITYPCAVGNWTLENAATGMLSKNINEISCELGNSLINTFGKWYAIETPEMKYDKIAVECVKPGEYIWRCTNCMKKHIDHPFVPFIGIEKVIIQCDHCGKEFLVVWNLDQYPVDPFDDISLNALKKEDALKQREELLKIVRAMDLISILMVEDVLDLNSSIDDLEASFKRHLNFKGELFPIVFVGSFPEADREMKKYIEVVSFIGIVMSEERIDMNTPIKNLLDGIKRQKAKVVKNDHKVGTKNELS
jgi:hypothetical protein